MTADEIETEKMRMRVRALTNNRIRKLESELADARRDTELLTRLVERMGEDLYAHCEDTWDEASDLICPYTIAGQRQYDAAMHEAEGAPPDAVSEGAWGHE